MRCLLAKLGGVSANRGKWAQEIALIDEVTRSYRVTKNGMIQLRPFTSQKAREIAEGIVANASRLNKCAEFPMFIENIYVYDNLDDPCRLFEEPLKIAYSVVQKPWVSDEALYILTKELVVDLRVSQELKDKMCGRAGVCIEINRILSSAHFSSLDIRNTEYENYSMVAIKRERVQPFSIDGHYSKIMSSSLDDFIQSQGKGYIEQCQSALEDLLEVNESKCANKGFCGGRFRCGRYAWAWRPLDNGAVKWNSRAVKKKCPLHTSNGCSVSSKWV